MDDGTMDGLDVVACERCPDLVASRTQITNGAGAVDVDLLFVGEAPGEYEDEAGEPFVGRSGEVLDEVLEEIGIDRATVRITNCVRCRPPDNRDPTGEELTNCRPYLDREIGVVDPDLIVPLGKVPAEHLLDRSVQVTREAGSVETVSLGDAARTVMICVHPAASLYDPSQRETLVSTIAAAADRLGIAGGQSQLEDF
ncbi:MAG: uracil-DNA glycosylase family protein [Halobacteriaceae archaeon]